MKGVAIANERKALTGLRGIAVAIVVLSHLGNGGMDLVPGLRLDAIGKAGVWLFFSLSAFLLTSHLAALLSESERSRAREIGRYAINRFFRIFPLFIVVLAAHYAWGDLGIAGVFRHLALVEGMGELWAVPVEFQYYVVIPFLALLIAARGARIAGAFLIAALVASVVLCLIWPGKVFSNDLNLVFRLPAFLGGSLAVLWLPVIRARVLESTPFAASVILAAAASTYFYRAVVLDDSLVNLAPYVAVLLAVVWSGALLGASHESGVLARMLEIRPLALLGKISFGVYLWHMFPARFWMEHSTLPNWVTAWLVAAIAIALATLTYVTIERPGILLGRRLGDALFKEGNDSSRGRTDERGHGVSRSPQTGQTSQDREDRSQSRSTR